MMDLWTEIALVVSGIWGVAFLLARDYESEAEKKHLKNIEARIGLLETKQE